MEIGGRLKKKKKRNGNGTQERRVIRDRHTATRIKEFHAFLFFFFFRAALIYVEKNSGDERKE